ncbi:MAG: DNA-protecting protein DprA [Spirochaetes bacterium]|nr:MAG: DNA-protecting protein DprA [Spirochaetota bacterium]
MVDLIAFAINRMDFLKPREKLLFSELFEDRRGLLSLNISKIERIINRRLKRDSFDAHSLLKQAEDDMNYLTVRNFKYTFYWEADFPPQLREIWDPPLVMYYRGNLPDYHTPMVAIVGTRKPYGKALKAAYNLGHDFGQRGINVVSGLARGIDGSAHHGNLEGGGATAAVLGCGIDVIYPKEHKRLAQKILETGGIILTEYPPGTMPYKHHFPARNRIISGLSRAVVIIQASETSGALITADYALEQGRDIFIHKEGITGKPGRGGHLLFLDGAEIVQKAEDILKKWGYSNENSGNESSSNENVFSLTKGDCSLTAGEEMASLLEEELTGKITRFNGEYFRRFRI